MIMKSFKHVNKPMEKIVEKLEKSTITMQEAAGDHSKLQGMVNLQRIQYEEIRKMVDATTKYEGLLEILENQANDIEELKSKIDDIQDHVVAQKVWLTENDKEISLLPEIKETQEILMIHVAELINTLSGDDAKKGKVKKGEGVSRSQSRSQSQQLKPTSTSSKSKDWYDVSKTIVQDPYVEFAPLSREALMERFKGLDDISFFEQNI